MGKRLADKLNRTRAIGRAAYDALMMARSRGATPDDEVAIAAELLCRQSPTRLTRQDARRHIGRVLAKLQPYEPPQFADDGITVRRWPTWIDAMARSKNPAGDPGLVSREDIWRMFRDQGGRCLLSGIAFSPEPFFNDSLVTRPFAPSLDRLDGTRGYQRDNVRLVCTIANFAMNRWGETVLFQLAQGIVAHQGFELAVVPDDTDGTTPA
ncbi:hypothetical protein JL100_030240 (plasmid) [Skermanella mucosa]|uniref:hypothetical protein n=1 Tax=Skermanella mucosa TaxID=1789672 RepID=UPI00192AED96|nr:hypothetical protein [Skermanella mucosa]UEM24512.1 hypothetical protein JL100_030240 [Skermanella mucosa]